MTTELLLAFSVYALVSAITPGPNNMMVMASGLNYGLKRTIPHLAGIVLGFGLLVFLAGIGLLSVLDYVPFLYEVLHVASVLYLLYLAWKIATARPIASEKSSTSKPISFLQAVAFQWVNPKALVMAMAAITTYVPETPESEFFSNVVIVSILYAVITFPCVGIWAVFGNAFRRFLSKPLYYRIFNVTMAILLVLSLYPLLGEIHF
jgi:threonine/homoserine/homoserine lactone efflux protein